MVKHKTNFRIVKVPLDYEPAQYPQEFQRFPRLYLEIIENKSKIQQHLINKEHIPSNRFQPSFAPPPPRPDTPPSLSEAYPTESRKQPKVKKSSLDHILDSEPESYLSDISTEKSFDPSVSSSARKKSRKSRKRKSSVKERLENLSVKDEDEVLSVLSDPPPKPPTTNSEASDDLLARLKELEDVRPPRDADEETVRSEIQRDYLSRQKDGVELQPRKKPSKKPDRKPRPADPLSDVEDDNISVVSSVKSTASTVVHTKPERTEKTSRPSMPDRPTHNPFHQEDTAAPSLEELQKQGSYVPRTNYRDMGIPDRNEEEEQDIKRELIYKFEQMRKIYPAMNIPEYTIHSELRTMQASFNEIKRRLSVESSVETWKTILVIVFQVTELFMGRVLNLDAEGFFNQQMITIHKYNELLYEMGEKNYASFTANWPVEVRLIWMVATQAGLFIMMKMVAKKGADIGNILSSIFNKPNSGPPPKKRNMRPPDVNLDDLG